MDSNRDVEAQLPPIQPLFPLARSPLSLIMKEEEEEYFECCQTQDEDVDARWSPSPTGSMDKGVQTVETRITQDGIARMGSRASRLSIRSKLERSASKMSKVNKIEPLPASPLPLSDLEKGVVGWDSQDDPTMPLNFAQSRKYWIVGVLSVMTLMTPLSSSILAPAIKYINDDFHNTDSTLGTMPVSIYLLGYAVGPLFLAPMSEVEGRWIILTLSNIFFCLWHVGCALAPSLDALIVFRFLSGVGGSGCMTLGGGIIADVFPIEQRGFALSLWSVSMTVGPSLGPLVGAFVAGSIGWRWAPWIVMIPSVVCTILLAFILPETNHRILIKRKVKALSKAHQQLDLSSCYETEATRNQSRVAGLKTSLFRPLQILFLSPMVTILSTYVSFVYGTIYLMYNTVPVVFEQRYGWSTGLTGVTFLSIAVGYFVGIFFFSTNSDRTVVKMTQANNGVFEPEMRLPIMLYYALITPITFFWYGWTAEYHIHWIVPVLGMFPLGVGIIGIWMPAQSYIIDANPVYAASSLAAFTVLRSTTAAFLPLAGPTMFGNLGLGWGNSVLGFICIAMIPIPVLLFRYGKVIRKRFAVEFE